MSRRRKREVNTMQEASTDVMFLPRTRSLELANGRKLELHRLDWASFELFWQELCGILAGFPEGAADNPDELLAQLGNAPQLVLRLAALSSGTSEAELARWDHGSVLELAAAALQFNFCETAGLRDFSGALATLWRSAQGEEQPETRT